MTKKKQTKPKRRTNYTYAKEYESAKATRHNMIRDLVINQRRFDILSEYVLGYDPQPFHLEMMDFQESNQEGMILGWRGAAKTTYLTITTCIGEILCDPNVRILICSDAAEQAKTFLRAVKLHFERNEELREIFGDYCLNAPKWADNEIIVNKRSSFAAEATITTIGYGSTLPGRHFDLTLCDDLITKDNAQTEGQRKKVHDWFYDTLLPCVQSPNGRLYVIGTRWHEEDLYGWLQDEDYADAFIIFSVLDEDDRSVWEDVFPTARMHRIRKGNLRAFELQYMCKPGENLGGIFTPEHFRYYEHLPAEVFKWQGVDLAIGQGSQHDHFAHCTIGVHKTSRDIYLIDYRKTKITFPRQVSFVANRWEEHRDVIRVVIESNSYQLALKQQMRESHPEVPVMGHPTIKDKVARAEQLSYYFTDRPLNVRRGHHEFIRLMCGFPSKKGSKDVMDALEIAIGRGLKGARKTRTRNLGLIGGRR